VLWNEAAFVRGKDGAVMEWYWQGKIEVF